MPAMITNMNMTAIIMNWVFTVKTLLSLFLSPQQQFLSMQRVPLVCWAGLGAFRLRGYAWLVHSVMCLTIFHELLLDPEDTVLNQQVQHGHSPPVRWRMLRKRDMEAVGRVRSGGTLHVKCKESLDYPAPICKSDSLKQ